jgi:hypothetical protein
MVTRAGLVMVAACALLACKQRGTETIELSFGSCSSTKLAVYFLLGNCNNGCDTSCSCATSCSGSNCTLGCREMGSDGFCSTDNLGGGLVISSPTTSGTYALIIDVLSADPVHTVLAESCTTVHIDADGTMNKTIPVMPMCCP